MLNFIAQEKVLPLNWMREKNVVDSDYFILTTKARGQRMHFALTNILLTEQLIHISIEKEILTVGLQLLGFWSFSD